MQEISPGFVYTEMIQRACKCDSETAKSIYDQILPEVKFNTLMLNRCVNFVLQALKPEDVGSTVLHVLSTPIRVQVCTYETSNVQLHHMFYVNYQVHEMIMFSTSETRY